MVKILPISHTNLALLIFLILFIPLIVFTQTTLHPTPIRLQVSFNAIAAIQ
jgi:hypothetical protein